MGEEDERRGGAVVAPEPERQRDQERRQAPRLRAAARGRVAVGHPHPVLDQQPAARQEVELVAADLAPRQHPGGEREADREQRPAQAAGRGRARRGAPIEEGHGARAYVAPAPRPHAA